MSLDVEGFTSEIGSGEVTIKISSDHRLLKLARNLPWDEMLDIILPDLKRTERKCWWMGRPMRVCIHVSDESNCNRFLMVAARVNLTEPRL